MVLGQLNFPKPQLENFSYIADIAARLYIQYSKLIETTVIGKQVLSDLEADPRVINLKDQLISDGSGASRFEPKVLAMWFLWAINEFGQETAKRSLDIFLDSTETTMINALWVLGIEVDDTIHLTNGLRITPISKMPNSREKEDYLKNTLGSIGRRHPKPKAAITHLRNLCKT